MINNIQKIFILGIINIIVIILVLFNEQQFDVKQNTTELDWKIPQISKPKLTNVKLTLWGNSNPQHRTTSRRSGYGRNKNSYSRNKNSKNLNLVAIIQQGKQHYVLFTNKKKVINQYTIGKKLPDGSELLKINDDSIEVIKDDKTEIIYLYSQKK
ncbi:MAG TPA: hypothetical protein ENK59_05205 [Thioploca sp.]|nr:hypothetical protein [Thioploca sp.]